MVRPTCPITHIIFKEGKPGTVDRWAGHPEPKPFIVGIGWVVRCRESTSHLLLCRPVPRLSPLRSPAMSHAAESPYIVEITREAVASKRRRSMEPKALALANAGLLSSSHLGPPPVASCVFFLSLSLMEWEAERMPSSTEHRRIDRTSQAEEPPVRTQK